MHQPIAEAGFADKLARVKRKAQRVSRELARQKDTDLFEAGVLRGLRRAVRILEPPKEGAGFDPVLLIVEAPTEATRIRRLRTAVRRQKSKVERERPPLPTTRGELSGLRDALRIMTGDRE